MEAMHSTKRVVFPLIILVVLVVLVLIVTDPFGWLRPASDQPDEDEPQQITLCDVTESQITAFEIAQQEDEPFRLERDGDAWWVVRGERRYRANADRLEKLLEQIPGLSSSGLATDKPENHATYELDEAQAIGLKVYTGNASPAVHLLIGKATPNYEGAFVCLSGQNEVYRAMENIKSLVGFSFRDYRTKQPWAFDPQLLQSVTIAPPPELEGEALTFTRSEGFWKTPDGANGNQNALTELVEKLSDLTVSDFVDESDPEETGLSEAQPCLVFNGADGEFALTLGTVDASQYFVADQDGNVYKASEYSLKPYLELAFDELTFDDTAPVVEELSNAGEEPDEGVYSDLLSDAEESGE